MKLSTVVANEIYTVSQKESPTISTVTCKIAWCWPMRTQARRPKF